jgi:hypothetical protein
MACTLGRISAAALLLGGTAFAQPTANAYLDVLNIQVKPGKRAEFEGVVKKIADANRRYKGSDWITYASEFGAGGAYIMASPRKDYAAVELASRMFEQALAEAFTPAGAMKILTDAASLIASSRSELRRRRPDLSWNAPSDPNELSKIIGQSRWMRTTTYKVRSGRQFDFEDALLKVVKPNVENAEPRLIMLVSQSGDGSEGLEYHFTTFRTSLAGFDQNPSPTLRESLGEEGFRRLHTSMADVETNVSSVLYRIVPELSKPAEPIAAADAAFWNPKPPATAARRAPPKPHPDEPAAPRK